MSWAKRKRSKVTEKKDRPSFDITEMTSLNCSSCGVQLKYVLKSKIPKEPVYCETCEKERSKYKIPW